MVWAWMLWSAYALGTRREIGLGMDALVSALIKTRTELWFGHGCSGQRMLLKHDGNYGLGMDAPVTLCSWNTNGNMVWAWMLWSAHSSKHERNYGLGTDALVSVCSWNTKGIMVWAWMLWSAYALVTRREIWFGRFGHGCSGQLIKTRTELWFGHGCSGQRMLLEHERNYGLGMDALVSVCSCNAKRNMVWAVWAWMPWSAHSSKHERNYGLGMDALVSVLIKTQTELWFGMDALVSVMLLEHEQTYWPSQYFVKVVSCRSARYTVRVSESRLRDASKFLHFAETQKCRRHQHFAHFQVFENPRNTARASKFGLGRGR